MEIRQEVRRSAVMSAEQSKVLRNTYMLLAITLAFSAAMSALAIAIGAQPVNIFVMLIGAYGLMFLTHFLRNSAWGLLSVLAFTGFMGYTLGPVLGFYLQSAAGAQSVVLALGMTAAVFVSLSSYVLVTGKDMSFLGGFVFAGAIVLLIAMLVGIFVNIPGFHLAISAGFVLFSSAVILLQTSSIVHGGERNYVMATITLYVSIYNLFVSLLSLISAFNRD